MEPIITKKKTNLLINIKNQNNITRFLLLLLSRRGKKSVKFDGCCENGRQVGIKCRAFSIKAVAAHASEPQKKRNLVTVTFYSHSLILHIDTHSYTRNRWCSNCKMRRWKSKLIRKKMLHSHIIFRNGHTHKMINKDKQKTFEIKNKIKEKINFWNEKIIEIIFFAFFIGKLTIFRNICLIRFQMEKFKFLSFLSSSVSNCYYRWLPLIILVPNFVYKSFLHANTIFEYFCMLKVLYLFSNSWFNFYVRLALIFSQTAICLWKN